MSLVRAAARICAVLALEGRTLAGPWTYDSRLDTLDRMVKGDSMSVLAVYTDTMTRQSKTGRPVVNMAVDFAIRLRATPPHGLIDADAPEAVFGVAYTDPDLELNLDLFEQEIRDALSRPDTPAGDLFLSLCQTGMDPHRADLKVESLRGADEEGTRYVARQLQMEIELNVDPPVPGDARPAWLDRFLDLVSRHESYDRIAPMLSAYLGRETGRAQDWREAAQAQLDAATARALGVAALARTDEDAPVIWGEASAPAPLEGFHLPGDERE